MKKQITIIFILALLIVPSLVYAVDYPKAYDDYVNDYAKMFSAPETAYLRALLNEVRQNTTAQVVVVTMPSIDGNDLSQYAVDLGKQWKVGESDKNNGMVILYVIDQNKIFVATGYGLEGILPDSKVGRILDENYVPLRNSGNVSEGIIKFSNVIYDILIQNADEIKSGNSAGNNKINIDPFWIFIIIMIIFTIISRISSAKKNKKNSGLWWLPIFLPFPRGGGSSGGFGGGGFGGGGFGGGGAGR